jgi:hypothetical protein
VPALPSSILEPLWVQIGCGYRRIADHTCSATTLRRRREDDGIPLAAVPAPANHRDDGLLDLLPLGRPPPPPPMTAYWRRP